MREHNTYTGTLTYKEIIFTFIFDKKTLKLIPPKEKKVKLDFGFWKK